MKNSDYFFRCVVLCALMVTGARVSAQDVVDVDGQVRVVPYPIEEKWLNPWPEAWEDAFWVRANELIRRHGRAGRFGNKHFENEKSSYPNAFMGFLAGHRAPALGFLQAEDTQAGAWHQHTEGIDFYAAFTLKGQMRKFFFFRNWLEPEYRDRMRRGAANWTRTDPRETPTLSSSATIRVWRAGPRSGLATAKWTGAEPTISSPCPPPPPSSWRRRPGIRPRWKPTATTSTAMCGPCTTSAWENGTPPPIMATPWRPI